MKTRGPGSAWRLWLPPLIAFALAALIWQLYAAANPYVIPRLEEVWASIADDPDTYLTNLGTTLGEIAIGAGGGILIAFVLALLMAELPILEQALMPMMVIMMVTPIVAIAPALVVAFGFGMLPKYLVAGLVVFFPMLVNSLAGLRDIDQRTLDVLRTLNASRWEVLWRLRLPSSMPFVFAGLRIALPLSIVGATVAEFAAAGEQAGLGALITVAAAQANLPIIWASIAILCLLGVSMIAVLAAIRAKVLWWDSANRSAR